MMRAVPRQEEGGAGRLGGCRAGFPSGGFTTLLRVQGEQWILATSSYSRSKQSKQQKGQRSRGPKPASRWLESTAEQMRINSNEFRVFWAVCFSRFLARFMADVVSQSGWFSRVFRTTIRKVQDIRQRVQALATRALLLPWQLGRHMIANGCSMASPFRRGAMRWPILG